MKRCVEKDEWMDVRMEEQIKEGEERWLDLGLLRTGKLRENILFFF